MFDDINDDMFVIVAKLTFVNIKNSLFANNSNNNLVVLTKNIVKKFTGTKI